MRRFDDDGGLDDLPSAPRLASHCERGYACGRKDSSRPAAKYHFSNRDNHNGAGTIEALRIGQQYQTTYGTLWKDGTYFARGTRVIVTGLHLEQGFCVRFPADVAGDPLETWEDWAETEFLAPDGSIDGAPDLSAGVLAEAREVLDDAEDGTHLHLHEDD